MRLCIGKSQYRGRISHGITAATMEMVGQDKAGQNGIACFWCNCTWWRPLSAEGYCIRLFWRVDVLHYILYVPLG